MDVVSLDSLKNSDLLHLSLNTYHLSLKTLRVAKTFRERAVGLIGYDLAPGEGLLIPKCNAIHTFFMSYPIDAIFLDKKMKVVKIVKNIKPNKFLVFGGFRARSVLEVKSCN